MLPQQLTIRVQPIAARVQQWTIRRPIASGAVAAVLTGSSIAYGLYRVGFGSKGVRPESYAAIWHAKIGNVESGSVFSILQSAGAGGAGAFIVYGVPAASAAAITIGSRYRARLRARPSRAGKQ